MTIETIVYNALRALVSDRCYADLAPDVAIKPYIVYQAVGGGSINYTDPTIPDKSNTRMQVAVWADTRTQASTIAKQIEDIMRTHPTMQTTVLGQPVSDYDEATKLRGARQDYSIWA
jgi:hypothetical protein